MEGEEILASDGVEVRLGHAAAAVVVLSVQEPVPLALEDVGGVVVSLPERLEDVRFLELDAARVEARLAQHVEEKLQRGPEDRGDATEARAGAAVASEARERGG